MPLVETILLAQLIQCAAHYKPAHPSMQRQEISKTYESVTEISFKDFFATLNGELKPSEKLLGMNGKRVRLVGFMAQLESPPRGAFFLCPRPITCDEEGAGTADLPPESVLVIARSWKGKAIPFSPRTLEVTGILAVGNLQDEEGRVSFIRLILDRP